MDRTLKALVSGHTRAVNPGHPLGRPTDSQPRVRPQATDVPAEMASEPETGPQLRAGRCGEVADGSIPRES